MDTPHGLSDQQRRYVELTRTCGLSFEEAMHALGRWKGAADEYRQLSRHEQSLAKAPLMQRGLSEKEARRVVGLPSAQPSVNLASNSSSFQNIGFASGCSGCGISDYIFVVINGKRLCPDCRRKLKKARKADKKKASTVAYYNALSHPEGRGLKGYLK